MRATARQVIAIYGRSLVGKTTVARLLAEEMGWGCRACGDAVVDAAARLGLRVDDLPASVHREVDAGTRKAAGAGDGAGVVIEGRYLQYVLANERRAVFVELTCDSGVRTRRLAKRVSVGSSIRGVEESDAADDQFCEELYSGVREGPQVVIDTSGLTAADVVAGIRQELGI